MARVTVEDCILNIPNRFELVVVAAQRAKQISAGAPLTVDRDNDKDAVVALREIADKTIEPEKLVEEIILSNCKKQPREEFEATPFAGEIEDQMMGNLSQMMAEEARHVKSDSDEAVEGLSFGEDDVSGDD